MLFTISGKHIDITDALRTHAQEKTDKLPKHFDDISSVEVLIDKQPAGKISAEIIVKAKQNKIFVVTETTEDAYKSIDLAIHTIEGQLRKAKEKQRDSHKHNTAENE